MIEQGTPEWHKQRLGKVTASRIADIMAVTKTGPAASRANYIAELVAARLTGIVPESFSNDAMKWGILHEPFARAKYEVLRGVMVEEVGFIDHPDVSMSGASPDGLVGVDGMLEIKCPNTATHIEFLLTGKIPQKYLYQIAWQLSCCDRDWCDYASYDPRLPEKLQLKVVRVARDHALNGSLMIAVTEFNDEVSATVAKLNSLGDINHGISQ